MLGDMRVFDLGDELLLDCERVALQELFNMIHRYKLGRDVELHKRTLQMGLLSVIGPDAPALAGPHEHDNARVTLGGARRRRGDAPTSASTCSSRAADRDAVRARAATFPDGDEAAAEIVRVEHGPPALRRRPRRHRDPAGSRASTSAPSPSPRAVTSARRRSRGCTTAASRTGACSACA